MHRMQIMTTSFSHSGLPISLKDQVEVEGTNFTMCYVGWVGKKAEHNAIIAEILLKQGAVLYCRTNMSQGLWFGEGYNNLFGRTTNPYNRNVTCGGSSGGEGALIGLRGSLLGVGSDIGGSVRIPAAYQGLYGLRGSYARIPYSKATNSSEGQEIVRSVLGPLTVSIDGLKLFYKSVLDARPWNLDPWTPRMPWSEERYNLSEHGEGNKLCFAIMWDDGVCIPAPPYKRALEETKKALLAAGHEVVDWVPFKSAEAVEIITSIWNSDGGHDIKKQLALSGEPQLGYNLDPNARDMPAHELFDLCFRRTNYIKSALDHWNATAIQTSTGRPVDAIITPASACAPQQHDTTMYLGYTGFCNLMDYTTSVFPVTKVDPKVDIKEPREKFLSTDDKRNYDAYDPEFQRGAPCSLQVVGGKYEEEAVIKLTEIVDAAIKAKRAAT
ncbi:hypothetical protein CI109_106264 [Kwoniella shandongensis]|uniref:amidase n=1 Tax=Kwoniella shandongensis TaxID=1734106 RepID=A0A5M6C2V4_9TREE|nr:uncharacterized protein CI109_003867 [Kwoniella shandongensis]KAA5527895.1 hypothetical protein CI109_003867 [Kwoniella shandongensis]